MLAVKPLLRSKAMPLTDGPFLPDCVCATLRQSSRALTQLYDAALRPVGLTAMQFQLLLTLQKAGPVTVKALAVALTIDQTTLTRSLALLEKNKWIVAHPQPDRRLRAFALSRSGTALLERALPHWTRVQQEVLRHLDSETWAKTRAQFLDLIAFATADGGPH